MRTSIAQSVLNHIQSAAMVAPGDRVGVAVSGGGDSVALLRILEEIRDALGVSLSVVHFDHQLRGCESDNDARFVSELARTRGLDFIWEGEDVAAKAKRNKWNVEDAGRRLRYGFFQQLIQDGRVTRIAVAHTADDQAETVLSHIMRGTGLAGLRGIHPLSGVGSKTVVRPLLPFRRNELRAYLANIAQPWREDSTNSDLRRMRGRIRARLLPFLERDFSPRVVEHLSDLARLAREEQVFWAALVEERYEALVQYSANAISVRVADLLDPLGHPDIESKTNRRLPPSEAARPLTERLIRRLYEEVQGTTSGLGADHVEQVIRLATRSASGRRVQLPHGIVVERVFDKLYVTRAGAEEATSTRSETVSTPIAYQYMVALPDPDSGPAIVSVPEVGSRFRLKLIDWAKTERETTKDSQTFDADSLRAPLILRNWRPGDTYTPCGRRHSRKLKQMLLAARVPVRQRQEWPVLESAGAVVWARGMPVAEAVRVTDSTRAGVEIAEEKLQG